MEEADRILINSLISIGLEVTDENLSFEDFSPNILINATSICLECIFESKNEQQSFPKSCPDNMASRYKVGQALSEALKSLGYKDAIGYQSFLYPNVKDSRKIISFLIENLPKESGPAVIESLDEANKLKSVIKKTFAENWKSPWLPYYCRNEHIFGGNVVNKCLLIGFSEDRSQMTHLTDWLDSFPHISSQVGDYSELLALARNYDIRTALVSQINVLQLTEQIKQLNETERLNQLSSESTKLQKPEIRKRTKFMPVNLEKEEVKDESNEDEMELLQQLQQAYESGLAKGDTLADELDRLAAKYDRLVQGERELTSQLDAYSRRAAVQDKLERVLEGGSGSVDKLEAAVLKRRVQLEKLDLQWRDHRADLDQRMAAARATRVTRGGKTADLERQLELVRADMAACRLDYGDKDESIRQLDEKVKHVINAREKQNHRNEFTKRILELTENKRKQNVEIRKILADIFQLQKEINSLRGKLDRSYKETSDCIAEFARKDEMSKKMHKVLVGIHENCSNLVEIIEERGRLMREIRDLETTIENENRENVEKNLEKIQHDYEEAEKNCANLKKAIKDYKLQLAQ